MTTTENTENAGSEEAANGEASGSERKFSSLVLFACILSIGSLAYTTWSFLDLNKIDAMKIQELGNVSLIGLSAAAAMDVFWTATMVAEYRGRKIMGRFGPKGKGKGGRRERINILPHIGWLEVLAIAAMLGYHGHEMGGWAAAFTAVLPVATKFVWTLALDDIRDPFALNEEEKTEVAEERRAARLAKEKSDASALKHLADMEALRRKNAADLEEARAKAERQKIELQAKFELEKANEEGQAEVAIMRDRLKATVRIERLRSDNEIDMQVLDAQRELRLASVGGFGGRMIQGETVNRPQLAQGDDPESSLVSFLLESPAFASLSEAEQRRSVLAARYYTVDHREGGVTKADFCRANGGLNAPRLTEATKEFPVEWFIENNLAVWAQ